MKEVTQNIVPIATAPIPRAAPPAAVAACWDNFFWSICIPWEDVTFSIIFLQKLDTASPTVLPGSHFPAASTTVCIADLILPTAASTPCLALSLAKVEVSLILFAVSEFIPVLNILLADSVPVENLLDAQSFRLLAAVLALSQRDGLVALFSIIFAPLFAACCASFLWWRAMLFSVAFCWANSAFLASIAFLYWVVGLFLGPSVSRPVVGTLFPLTLSMIFSTP